MINSELEKSNKTKITMTNRDLNKIAQTNVAIEEGEELLHTHYPLSVVNKKVRVLAGIDAGSTQTRVVLIDSATAEPDLTIYSVPSVSCTVSNDVEIRPQGDLLYNLMDSTIVNKKVSNETIFTKERIVRGSKKTDFGGAENRISSTMQKISSKVFYMNVIDAIGYALCQKYKDKIPSDIELVVGVALPPDDRQSTANREKFRKQLLGSYTWAHTDSKVEINLDIAETDILTEPEAFIKAYYIEQDEEVPEYVLHVNGGGRSIGVELLKNGVPMERTSKSLYYGGSQLIENLATLIAKSEGGREPNTNSLRKALNTGYLARGKESKDIIKYIKTSKEEMANQILADIIKYVFDVQQEVSIEDVAEISVSGRLFESGDYDISIADFIESKFKEMSPSTDFVVFEGNYIPLGLCYQVYAEYSDFLEEAEEIAIDSNESNTGKVVNFASDN